MILDAGLQIAQVNHQAAVFALDDTARSRINTAYMTAFFAGGVVGSIATAFTYRELGWLGTCTVGAAFALAACILWLHQVHA
jgi:cyanate permease